MSRNITLRQLIITMVALFTLLMGMTAATFAQNDTDDADTQAGGKLYLPFVADSSADAAAALSPNLVISQVYGGGGNKDATLKNDFVELFNRGTSLVSVDGWSLQYAPPSNSKWDSTPLSGTIAPGQYYLVQEGAGTGGTVDLPSPDARDVIRINAEAGKVALVNNRTRLSGSCPTGDDIVDLVGYGSVTCSETSTAPTLSNTTAALRHSNGCRETDNNSTDFTDTSPNPRNRTSPSNPCSGSDPTPNVSCTEPFTPLYTIQGSGATAAITGTVTTQGVVVGDYELPAGTGQIRGFYLQDQTGDGNLATSDGIFVFDNGTDNVSLGQVVRVQGTVVEFQEQTQISNATITQCGSSGTVTPLDVSLPFASPNAAERYEGMLVRLSQTLYVSEHFQLGRFGQIVLSSNGRLRQPTHVTTPGPAALALQAQNDLNRILIDDDNNLQNPDPIAFGREGNPLSASNTLRAGDTVTGIVGVMVYGWAGNVASGNAYRVRPLQALGGGSPNFQPANPRLTTPPDVGGTLKVTGINLLNFFNTFKNACTNGIGGASTECRGAETPEEFDRQWPKSVAAIIGTGADVIGVVEVENDGYATNSALQFLIDKLNAATAAGTYALIDVDAATSQVNALGSDAIKVGLIYKPGKVTPVGTTAVLNSPAFVNGGDSAARNRPSLTQAFQEKATGARFIVNVNHLKSKGSACDTADAGDGQGNCNRVRTNAATTLLSWLASNPTGTGDTDLLILGDLNSYAKEDPITTLTSGSLTNLIAAFHADDAYSYVFDGQWGYLDHALGSATLVSQVTGVADWHINADEPSVLDYNTNSKSAAQLTSLYAADAFRVSDHDPVLVGLNLAAERALAVEGNALLIHSGDFKPSLADQTDFGTVILGSAVTHTFTLRNTGNTAITLTGSPSVAISGTNASEFIVTAQPTTTLLANGEQTTFQLTFAPSEAGVGTATVSIVSSEVGVSPYTFAIQGNGAGTATFPPFPYAILMPIVRR